MNQTEELQVSLSNVPCGTVYQTKQGDLKFEYLSSYGEASTPVSLSMPVGFLTFPKKVILPYLQGLLPDNETALKALGRKYGANPANPFALLKYVGDEVAGALSFGGNQVRTQGTVNKSRPLTDLDIENMLLEKVNEYEDGTVGAGKSNNLSLAGAHPKIGLIFTPDGNWHSPNNDQVSTHIIKPVPSRWKNLDVVEHQTMRAAELLGLDVAKSEIRTFGSTKAFITERYDRKIDEKGALARLHQEDLCQALSVSPSKKYQRREGGPGVGEIARLFKQVESSDQHDLAQRFFKGLAFNVFAGCTDAHAKNYSVLLQNTSVRLAPLYDLASTLVYSIEKESAMAINGQYRLNQIQTKDFLREAYRLGLEVDWAEDAMRHLEENLLDAFSQAGETIRKDTSSPEVAETTKSVVSAIKEYRG